MVEPMSPRLASAMAMRPLARAAASTSSRAAIPPEPRRSKKATCGLTTGTTPAKASTQARPKVRTPAGVSGNPQAARSSADGSMPAHNGPVAATALATLVANPSVMPPPVVPSFRRPVTRSSMGHAPQ